MIVLSVQHYQYQNHIFFAENSFFIHFFKFSYFYKSFIVGGILDIASTRNKRVYNTSQSDDVADKKAIFNDWYMIGNDIRGAYEQFKKEVKTQA